MPNLTTEVLIPTNFKPNSSMQTGDMLYYSPAAGQAGGFSYSTSTYLLGEVTEIIEIDGVWNIGFNYTSLLISITTIENIKQSAAPIFLTFRKDCTINSSSLKGYFASARFMNDDYSSQNEMYSVTSEISISSK
tara:strand:+ start:2549 stop:2950 length:402 start_codon:yes stop_codon:yes gene_type:complete